MKNYLAIAFGILIPFKAEGMNSEISCLAINIYHEARNQEPAGQIAVGNVTINRMKSNKFPDSICEVITEAKTLNGKPIRNRCSFSWWCDGKSDEPKDIESYSKAVDIAYLLLDPEARMHDNTDGALWYHAEYVTPWWSANYNQTVKIGDHIFYRK